MDAVTRKTFSSLTGKPAAKQAASVRQTLDAITPVGANRSLRIVRPITSRLETLAMLSAVVTAAATSAGLIALRERTPGPPALLSWQLRSFDGLRAADQAIHSALLPAAEEITWYNNDTGGWITIAGAQEKLLPPFYRDAFWKTNGEVHWQLILPGYHEAQGVGREEPADHIATPATQPTPNAVSEGTLGQGATVYYGTGGRVPGQGAYLLVIGHAHAGVMWTNQSTIWLHPDPNAPYPGVVKPEALVSKGWRQVVPYNGASEVERVKGTGNGR